MSNLKKCELESKTKTFAETTQEKENLERTINNNNKSLNVDYIDELSKSILEEQIKEAEKRLIEVNELLNNISDRVNFLLKYNDKF